MNNFELALMLSGEKDLVIFNLRQQLSQAQQELEAVKLELEQIKQELQPKGGAKHDSK